MTPRKITKKSDKPPLKGTPKSENLQKCPFEKPMHNNIITQTPVKKRITKKSDNSRKSLLNADRQARFRERGRMVALPSVKKSRRKIPGLWEFGERYFSAKFTLKPSNYHRELVSAMERVIRDGGNYAYALPRGSAKTTWTMIGVLWAILYGFRRFIIPIAANASAASELLDMIKSELECNELLLKDFPLVCVPVRAAKGAALRARNMLDSEGNSISFEWSSDLVTLPAVKGLAVGGSAIKCVGISGRIRGLLLSMPDGSQVRPDLVLLDDPQKRSDAKSPTRVEKLLKTITGDVLGLAGPGKTIASLCAGTIIERDDVMDILTNHKRSPSWSGVRVSMLESRSEHEDLWFGDYRALRSEAQIEGRFPDEATEFYKLHREKMDLGARAYWDARKLPGDISAIQHAYNLLMDQGETVFASEYQNNPIVKNISALYELTPELVVNHLSHLPRLHSPALEVTVTAGVDINKHGLTWVLLATDRTYSSRIIGYGIFNLPGKQMLFTEKTAKNLNAESQNLAIYKTLDGLMNYFESLDLRSHNGNQLALRRVCIDAGWANDTVRRFVISNQRRRFALFCSRGRNYSQFRPNGANVEKRGENWIEISDRIGVQIIYNADTMKEQTQTAFLLPHGAPGALTLWGDNASVHADFARQICAEKLIDKTEGRVDLYYKWVITGGQHNDYLDTCVIARVMALYGGASVLAALKVSPSGNSGSSGNSGDIPQSPKRKRRPMISYDSNYQL